MDGMGRGCVCDVIWWAGQDGSRGGLLDLPSFAAAFGAPMLPKPIFRGAAAVEDVAPDLPT
jgi:hypothetical protein